MKTAIKSLKEYAYAIPDDLSEAYKKYLEELFSNRLKIAYLLALILIPAAMFFDLLIFPSIWRRLMVTRLLTTAVIFLLFAVSYNTKLKLYPSKMCHLLNVAITSGIVYLTYLTGGYASPYYAGLILIFIAIAMVMPWGIYGSTVAGLTTLSIYYSYNLIPPLSIGEKIHWPTVWNSLYFLAFSFGMVVFSSGIVENYRRRIFVSSEQEKIKAKKIEEAKEEIDRLMKIKNRFLANITHELKTPLSIVIGNTEVIQESYPDLDDNALRQLSVVQMAAQQLATHVDRLISLSQSDDPEVSLRREIAPYLDIVTNIFSLFETQATQERKTYSLDLPPMPLIANIDVSRIEEVLINLIQNAFKFTNAGDSITMAIGTDGESIVTEISDTGIGIQAHQLDSIFERLYQGDNVLSRRHAGIGVGLYICKRNVELHGGTINVHSIPDKGSSFRFSLPLHLDQSTAAGPDWEGEERRAVDRRTVADRRLKSPRQRFEYQLRYGFEDLAKMSFAEDLGTYENLSPSRSTILLVEDNPGMMKILIDAMRQDYNLLLAPDGFEAINKLRENTDRVSLILTDIMMPGMNGIDFCKTIMANRDWEHIPIIFITALMKEEDQIRGFEAGATDYIVKPLSIKILREKVAHWISRRQYEMLLHNLTATLEPRLQEMTKLKDIIIHEINNPLQIIECADSLLFTTSEQSMPEKLRESVQKYSSMVKDSVETIKSVINVAHQLGLEGLPSKQSEHVSTLFTDTVAQCGHLLNKIRLEVNTNSVKDIKIIGDRRMLTQVFVNLVRNAVEAIREKGNEDEGLITIKADVKPWNKILIHISDNGIGIPFENQKNLFLFRYTTKKDGTGIGLHLSKMIIKLHEGDISLKSRGEGGTTFTVTLPTQSAETTGHVDHH